MALPTTLVTNEVKNSAGTEVEFLHHSLNGRTKEYLKSGELPGTPHRIRVSHSESGTGTSQRRRSVCRVDLTVTGQVDTSKQATISFYLVGDIPVGNLTAWTEPKNALANLLSFCASQGATTTILYDCTGYGAEAIVNGTL